jgi:hypothetical protein
MTRIVITAQVEEAVKQERVSGPTANYSKA